MPFKFCIGLLLWWFCTSVYADSSAPARPTFEPCRIGIAPATVAAQCASVTVPFTHDLVPVGSASPDKAMPATIDLLVAKIKARTAPATDDPLTILAGGPGQSATEAWPQLQAAFYPTLANRDVYLIDQRGTGGSARMDCAESSNDSSLTVDLDEVREQAAQCYASQPLATQWFTTSVAVRDLDLVREALGVTQWNLYGVSYGTRVALHYLRRYPQQTRSAILDAVVAPQKPIGAEIPVHSQAALDALFDRCASDAGCAAAFPDLPAKTDALFASLKDTPRTVQFENVVLGTVDSMDFNDQHLAATVRLLSYSSYGTAILPSMLYDAATNNNLAPFARQSAMQISQVGGSLATGMHAAVICSEDAPMLDDSTDTTALSQTYLGGLVVDAMVASCEQWPTGVVDSDFHTPVVSDVPVLALSGAVDPITPPAYAELAIASLKNAKHIVNPHQGHTQAPLGCMPTILSQFIDTANPHGLSLDCLDRLSPPALFVDANGPLP